MSDELKIKMEELEAIGEDAYLITATNAKNQFLRYDGENQAGDAIYRLMTGWEEAAIWRLCDAQEFIENYNLNNIVPIKVKEVLADQNK